MKVGERLKKRRKDLEIVSRGGSFLLEWMISNQGNSLGVGSGQGFLRLALAMTRN